MRGKMNTATLWIVVFLVFMLLGWQVLNKQNMETLPISEVMALGKAGHEEGKPNRIILSLEDRGGVLYGKYRKADDKGGVVEQPFNTSYMPNQEATILSWVADNGISRYSANRGSDILNHFVYPFAILVGAFFLFWMLLMRHFQSGSNKALSFGKSRAKLVTEGQVKATFADVAGIDEVKEELQEIIQFLKDPKRFTRLGGKMPKGALLYGPPGTGKTLIARAVAGEASVPFFSISGSDFVEMFVGVGASRVRDLFEQGMKAKPCLIYIDEIDAVGRHRFAGIGGGHDEREQTLNQLLVELDGFAPNEGVIVMASTNRPDVLDPALLRPGRFDRQIAVDLPDLKGREEILKVHTRDIKMAEGVDLRDLGRGTPGFSGADLANLANEAALLAARKGKDFVELLDLEEAKDRVMMGPQRRSMVLNEKERRNTAFHEAGHALTAKMTVNSKVKVHKVTIIPRGRALGLTWSLPEEEVHCQERSDLLNSLVYMMGGRVAESIEFGETTTGAANDLLRATDLAHRMVCEFGMSERLGPRTFGDASGGQVFLGRDMMHDRNYSEETASLIDAEVQQFLMNAQDEARRLLTEHREILTRVAESLLERETLSGDELDAVVHGQELPPLFRENGGTPQAPAQGEAEPEEKRAPAFELPAIVPPTSQPS
jgi:cell division protease FtsH